MAAISRKSRRTAASNYFMISFTDLFGGQRAKLVPAAAIADMQKDGAGFAGFATWLDMTPAHPDLFAMPDPDSVDPAPLEEGGRLGRRRQHRWTARRSSRRRALVLKNVVAAAADKGLRMKSGVEAEFFLITQATARRSPTNTTMRRSPATTSRR